MNMKLVGIFSVLAAILPAVVLAYANLGAPAGLVNDFAGMLAVSERQALEEKLAAFEKETSNEIAVAIISNLGGDTIENFAEKLFKDWGIGKPRRKVGVPTGASGQDNGVLILIAKDDRQMRIEVGYGLEGALTDAQSGEIIARIMRPAFAAGDFYAGIDGAVDAIMAATKGEHAALASPASESVFASDVAPALFQLFALLCFVYAAKLLGKSESWWAGGVIGGIIGAVVGLAQGFLYAGIAAIGILVPLGLLFDFAVSRSYKHHKSRGSLPWWFGGTGGWGGGNDSGGGFGGFGGGSSGGGGASGRW